MTKNHYNLIDEPWIPMVDAGLTSLKDVFSNNIYRGLGGNPVQKIAITKLLLAIAQAACTPEDDDDLVSLGASGLAQKCLAYLAVWHERFYLYGDQPFLQIPEIKAAAMQSYGAVLAEVSTGNTTVLTQSQTEKPLTNADKAMLIVQLMGFALGGKKVDNSVVLSDGCQNKSPAAKPGPSVGFLGFLHSFLQGQNVLETLWLNIFTKSQVASMDVYSQGVGTAPWEVMPTSEDCVVATALKFSLMGRLLPISRFCLFTENGLHYSEGILHPDYKGGGVDPSVSINYGGKVPRVLWADPDKRPWRMLTSMLAFFSRSSGDGFDCPQLRLNMARAVSHTKTIGVWSGGLRVSNNAGEQYVTGFNDFVESIIWLNCGWLGEIWFANLQQEMEELNNLSKIVYRATMGYFKNQNMDGKGLAARAGGVFWEQCNGHFQALVNACYNTDDAHNMRKIFARIACVSYDTYCLNDTARQMDSWAKNYPTFKKYLETKTLEDV
jgi:CRISPR system Cascade subunit CasA